MIQVRVYGTLWDHLEPSMALELGAPYIEVADLLTRLAIDPMEVGIVTVNGRQSRLDELVTDGCRVCIFAPMFGG